LLRIEGDGTGEIVDLHNQRGLVEKFSRELKGGFGMEWMPCGGSYTNALFFGVGVIACNLLIWPKHIPEKALFSWVWEVMLRKMH